MFKCSITTLAVTAGLAASAFAFSSTGASAATTGNARGVCHAQRTVAHHDRCARARDAHKLHSVARTVALQVTNGRTDICMVRVGGTSYMWCRDGRQYTS